MQPLEQLNNVQKARLIHALFLTEIPAFLEFTGSLSAYMAEHAEEVCENWKDQFFGANAWLSLAADAAMKLKRYGKQLNHSSSLFAEQLFDGHGAIFMNHCLSEFGKRGECAPKFKVAIDLFINP